MVEVCARHWAGEWRNYLIPPPEDQGHSYISEWIELTEGEFYRMEGYTMEWSGSDHFTAAVEFEMAETNGHHHARKEIQVLSILTDDIPEQFQITISGANGDGSYKVQFINPLYDPTDKDSVQLWRSDDIKANWDAWQVRDKIQGYFTSIWGSALDYERVDYDADGVETEDSELIASTVITFSLRKRINGPSFTTAQVMPAGLTSSVSISM